METETPAEPIVSRRSWKSVFFGLQIGSAHQFGKKCGFSATAEDALDHGLLVGIQGKWRPPGRCRSCNQYNSAPGCLVCNKAFEICSSALGAKTFGEVSLWTCDSRALFSG